MRSLNIFKAGAVLLALALTIVFSPQVNAQRAGAPLTAIQFNTNPFGGQLGHEQTLGTFGDVFGGGQWIGIGQPAIPGAPYGMRIQKGKDLATLSLNTLLSGDPGLELGYGGNYKQFNINWVFDPLNPSGKSAIMSFFADEVIGVRTENPIRTFTINHRNSTSGGGLTLLNEDTGRRWGMLSRSDASLALYYQGAFRGRFRNTDGIYFPVSDARMKSDIKDLNPVMDDIMKVRSTTYTVNAAEGDKNDSRSYGFIAQELKEIFPDMVMVSPKNEGDDNDLENLHSVGYTLMIPVLVKGMQEQQATIEEQQAQIDELKELLAANGSAKGAASVFGDSKANVLKQNAPNPFNNFTNIEYQLAPGFETATMVVFDLNGRQVMKFDNLSAGEGSVTVAANQLTPGMFLYSLLVDGEEVATKRMILTQ